MLKRFVTACEWLLAQLLLHTSPLVPQLQPGLTDEALAAQLTILPGQVSQEVMAFYRWHNGQALHHDGALMPFYLFLPVERAAQHYQRNLHQRSPYTPWHETWWPVWIDEDGRQEYFVICQPQPHDISTIYTLGPLDSFGEVRIAYDSLTTMIETLAACYEAGAYWLAWMWGSQEPYIDNDPQHVAAITRARNPIRTAWWMAYGWGSQDEESWNKLDRRAGTTETEQAVFARAVRAVQHRRELQTVTSLLQELQATDVVARRYAATLLGMYGDQQAVPPLVHALQDADHLVRWQAAEALGLLGDARAVLPLLQSLSEDRRDVTDVATEALGAWQVREAAAQALGRLGDRQAIPALMQVMQDAAFPQAYIRALGVLRAHEAIPMLLPLLRDTQPAVRSATAVALAQIGDQRAVEALCQALRDPIPNVRWQAAEALGHLGDPRALGPLARLEEDATSLVQEAASKARNALQGHNP